LDQPLDELVGTAEWQERIDVQTSELISIVRDLVINKLHPKEFERIIKDLLDLMKFGNTKLTAGPSENGADIVMSIDTPFFDALNVVVQIKHHPGEDNDATSIEQLETAFEYYKAVAGLLVTSGRTIGPQLRDAIERLKTSGKTVAVLHGDELYRLILRVLAADG
jgi:restriction endonuclease Mrr